MRSRIGVRALSWVLGCAMAAAQTPGDGVVGDDAARGDGAGNVAGSAASAPIERRGPIVDLTFHPGTLPAPLAARLADEAVAIIEAGWPVFTELVGSTWQLPLAVELHVDEPAFREMERKRYGDVGMRESVSPPELDRLHVLVLQSLTARTLAQIGFTETSRQAMLFALFHQALQRQLGERSDEWITFLVAFGALEAVCNPTGKDGVDALFDSRRVHASYRRVGLNQLVSVLTDDAVPATAESFYRVSCWRALLASTMAERGNWWAKRLLQNWQPARRRGRGEARRHAVESVLGKNWARTEQRFVKEMEKRRPLWSAMGPELRVGPDELLLAGGVENPAKLTRVEPVPDGDYELRMTLHCDADTAADAVRVWFDDGGEQILVLRFRAPKVAWVLERGGRGSVLDEVDLGLVPGQPYDVRFAVAGTRLTVHVDEKPVVDKSMASRGLHGQWGIYANDTVLRVRNLKIAPLPRR